MATQQTFVILGASLAGAKAAEALRTEGFDGRLVLVGQEAEYPYERPPLSKEYLQGKAERDTIFVYPAAWYAEHEVELLLGNRAVTLDRATRAVTLADGTQLGYDTLLFTTGSSPRRLDVPGADDPRVRYLRTVDDCESVKQTLQAAPRIAVIGAGWIGLEVTAAARLAGVEVTVVETLELPLLRVLGREVAQTFADLHREHGVDLRFGAQLSEIVAREAAPLVVRLADGAQVEADAVIVGVGITPNTQLAEAAGITVDNGIVVDEHLRSSDGDVYAAGDVANAFHPVLGKRIRVEHWANALNQPAVAARSMLGREAVYDRVPYFYTDQYDLGMEYAGYAGPGDYDQVVFRGDRDGLEFIAFWLADRRVVAGMNVNVWDVTDQIQDLVRAGRQVDVGRLADREVPLDEL